jgi:hypothetical protein
MATLASADRLAEVHAWQCFYGMVPRPDSRYAEKYSRGELAESADAVARELVCTNVLYEQTLYGEYLEEFMRSLATELKNRYSLTWTTTWNIVQFYGPLILKLLMVRECGIVMPHLARPGEVALQAPLWQEEVAAH